MSMRRRPERSAIVGLLVLVMLVVGLSRVTDLPLFGRHTTYHAEFRDAGGLKPGDPVKVAGVAVGSVEGVEISGDKVVITFDLDDDVRLGDQTTATVGSGSLLGDKVLKVVSQGPGRVPDGATIPLSRTTSAYDVVDAFADLTTTTEDLDKDKIASAFDTLAHTFDDSPQEVRAALKGLTRFSSSVAARDRDLQDLLTHAHSVTRVLDRRKADITSLLRHTNLLLGELSRRRSAIHDLLVSTHDLSEQLSGAVNDNQARLTPALRNLDGVTGLLVERQRELAMVIKNLEIYGRYYTNVVGSGPWFDNYIPRVPDSVDVEVNK
jgi:phospholipid/cholesterol/gamma-HCH transport system substrate-binding protein